MRFDEPQAAVTPGQLAVLVRRRSLPGRRADRARDRGAGADAVAARACGARGRLRHDDRSPTTRTLDRCLACDGTDLRPLRMRYEWRGPRSPPSSAPPAACASCACSRWAKRWPRMYSAEYFESRFPLRAQRHALVRRGRVPRRERRPARRASSAIAAPGGCSRWAAPSGWLLKHAAERGWQRDGRRAVERRRRARALAGRHGARGRRSRTAPLPSGAFDLVYMGDVLEHVPDCRDDGRAGARGCSRRAATSSCADRSPRTRWRARSRWRRCGAAGRDIVLREPPYHLWEFTPAPLARLVRAAGLEVVVLRAGKIAPGPRARRQERRRSAPPWP